ncbi:hypothetical protein cyc_01482 [Cyclospora cayetanensis]|uniref:Uncharacterized protein n=1 Tax=Cyclospora cayetanensis TaxID=88456 RepID=A0A1D3D6V6_9EIME|nr:hypothetical protein cyc_01482 [Cyclospora cayetanensis]
MQRHAFLNKGSSTGRGFAFCLRGGGTAPLPRGKSTTAATTAAQLHRPQSMWRLAEGKFATVAVTTAAAAIPAVARTVTTGVPRRAALPPAAVAASSPAPPAKAGGAAEAAASASPESPPDIFLECHTESCLPRQQHRQRERAAQSGETPSAATRRASAARSTSPAEAAVAAAADALPSCLPPAIRGATCKYANAILRGTLKRQHHQSLNAGFSAAPRFPLLLALLSDLADAEQQLQQRKQYSGGPLTRRRGRLLQLEQELAIPVLAPTTASSRRSSACLLRRRREPAAPLRQHWPTAAVGACAQRQQQQSLPS